MRRTRRLPIPLGVGSLLALLATACATARPNAQEAEAERPNVVLLMADDLGWGDVGFHGNAALRTPHLDAMAADGMVFRRFYAQAPVCSPTRGSCLTGRHPHRYGVFGANVGHLRAKERTLAEILREQGYATGHFGKWHLGTLTSDHSGKPGRDPAANHMDPGMAGFETWFSTEYAVATWDPYDPDHAHGPSFDVRNLYWEDGRNLTDPVAEGLVGDDSRMIVDRALPFVRSAVANGRPFLAVVWFHAPHVPVIAGPDAQAAYGHLIDGERHYYGCVGALDEQVGRLRAELEALGVAEDTLVAFCSDNGPEGNPGPSGRNQGSTGPFRGRKRSLYEGGVRVPGVFVWPGRIPAGAATDFPASTSDYVPTVLELLGLEEAAPLDGESLAGVLAGHTQERERPICFLTGAQRAASGPRYKLVQNLSEGRHRADDGEVPFAPWELYDLRDDPGETLNVIDHHPAAAAELRAALEAFTASCEASLEGHR